MTSVDSRTIYTRYWAGFVLICLIQVAFAWFAVSDIRQSQTLEMKAKSEQDLQFLYHVLQEKLQAKNYTSASSLIQTWGAQQTEHIAEISLTMDNGFVLGEYHSASSSKYLDTISIDIPYSYTGKATLNLVIDTGYIYHHFYRLGLFFGLILIIVNSLLAVMIQLFIRKRILTKTLDKQRRRLTVSVEELREEVSARQKAETDLRSSEEKYRILMDNQSDAIFLHEKHPEKFSCFAEVNKRAIENYGYSREEFLLLTVSDIIPATEIQRMTDNGIIGDIEKNRWTSFETLHIRKSGEAFPVDVKTTQIDWQGKKYILSTARDITERKKMQKREEQLEQQMLHAQKLESLGVLAGGIAHDLNNILMVILGHSDLATGKLSKDAPAMEHLDQVKKSARKAADLANQMLAYSGRGKFVVEPIDLSHLIEEMEHMLSVSISKKAVLRYDLNNLLPSINADATQMRQIIMNLVINASDAIGDKSGVIAISTGCMDCDRNYLSEVWLDENLPEGMYVYLEVADTGCGISKINIAKIFDPFFTTKFTGRGLGMSSVLGIVRGHKGAIKIYSEVGKGTTMKVLFPASDLPAVLYDNVGTIENFDISGTVLLVDDEEAMRSLGKNMLETFGLEVLTAADGREALKVYETHQDKILFVLMDLTMPHMDGEDAYRELRRINPSIKVIMSSGYNEQDVAQKFMGKGMAGFLKKPYQLSELQKAIQELFN
ncbi:response regulator [uncultured Desulfuromusa sp.]|uniref:hybrid sensor histidine kinase/response regulator n=1 Tax=uncultured Desulfuromusa sp. TaxID=219183 RepID=UPI002AA7E983|nr:response regulator [uncultured Desulfuromusa sp.]